MSTPPFIPSGPLPTFLKRRLNEADPRGADVLIRDRASDAPSDGDDPGRGTPQTDVDEASAASDAALTP